MNRKSRTWKSAQASGCCASASCAAGSGAPSARIAAAGSGGAHLAQLYTSCICRTNEHELGRRSRQRRALERMRTVARACGGVLVQVDAEADSRMDTCSSGVAELRCRPPSDGLEGVRRGAPCHGRPLQPQASRSRTDSCGRRQQRVSQEQELRAKLGQSQNGFLTFTTMGEAGSPIEHRAAAGLRCKASMSATAGGCRPRASWRTGDSSCRSVRL